tara:strand:+ start:515 stop:712 length:198 start_codon:yes stop_codon:yes gene_type:complete
MPEIVAAVIGATASVFLMAISNISTRRERDIREIFKRLNALELKVASLSEVGYTRQRNWRKTSSN